MKKIRIEIIPLTGIIVNDTIKINFLESKESVKNKIKEGYIEVKDQYRNQIYFCENNLCFEFNKADDLQYIGISKSECLDISIWGINPFGLVDEKLIASLSELGGMTVNSCGNYEEITEYTFYDKSIGLYRSISPKKLRMSIEEAKAEGYYNQDMEVEYKTSVFFDSIGIGVEKYYN